MRLSTAIDRFLAGYFATCKRSPKTIQAYTIDLEQFATFLGPRARLESVKPEALEDWAAELKEAEYASASIRRKFASLKVFFNYWVRRDVLHRSPAWKIRLDLAPERKLPKTLTLDEVNRLIAYAERQVGELPSDESPLPREQFLALRNLVIVEVLFATGIRVGELVSLSLTDYRSEESSFLINGKGARQRIALLTYKKLKSIVNFYMRERRGLGVSHGRFFTGLSGDPMSTQSVGNLVGTISRASIDKVVTPHTFRHTIATLLLKNGVSIRFVQVFLGHSSLATTEKYLHVNKEDMRLVLSEHHPMNRDYE